MENNNIINGAELNLEDLEQVNGGMSANQYIQATGDVYVREGPGLSYDSIDILYKGKKTPFLGEVRKDNRGVAWGKVSFKGKTGWVSSKYAKIVNG